MPISDYEDVEAIYDQMEELIGSGRGNEYIVIMGDWNAVVGEGKDGNVVGGYGLGRRNSRGKMMVDFCRRNKLAVMNTWYNHHERRRYTWKAPGIQEDFSWITLRLGSVIGTVSKMLTFPGADGNSDHNSVTIR